MLACLLASVSPTSRDMMNRTSLTTRFELHITGENLWAFATASFGEQYRNSVEIGGGWWCRIIGSFRNNTLFQHISTLLEIKPLCLNTLKLSQVQATSSRNHVVVFHKLRFVVILSSLQSRYRIASSVFCTECRYSMVQSQSLLFLSTSLLLSLLFLVSLTSAAQPSRYRTPYPASSSP